MSVSRRLEFIARTQLTGTAASVSFATGLSGFTKFFLVAYIVNDANIKDVGVRLNNDSGANYAYQRIGASDATVSANRATAQTKVLFNYITGVAASSVLMSVVQISKPVAAEVARMTYTVSFDGTGAGISVEAGGAEWTNTADLINRIDVVAMTNNITTGSRLLLFGSKD